MMQQCVRCLPAASGGRLLWRSLISRTLSNPASGEHGGASGESGESTLRSAVLNKALELVPSLGFTQAAIDQAAKEIGSPVSAAMSLFPRGGPAELCQHFVAVHNAATVRFLATTESTVLGHTVQDRLTAAVQHRLRPLVDVREHLGAAMVLQMSSLNMISHAAYSTALLVDEIWRCASLDEAGGVQWSQRRAVLAGAYVSCELFMVTDKSAECSATMRFARDRMGDVVRMDSVTDRLDAAGRILAKMIALRGRGSSSARDGASKRS